MNPNGTQKKRFYYDITMPNNIYTNPRGLPIPASFSETRDSPLFNDAPDKYCLSVTRFSVPSNSIPYQYVSTIYDVATPANPNKMIYSVSMKYLGITYREYLQWETQAAFAPVPPPPPLAGPDLRFKDPLFYYYYAMYSLNHFVSLINKALFRCFNNNIVPLLPAPVPPLLYQAPFLTFSGATKLFTLYTSALFTGDTPTIELGGNYQLDTCFVTSWNTIGIGIDRPDGLDFRWVCLATPENTEVDPVDPLGFRFSFQQEFDTTGSISKFASLLFVSPTLPCNTDIVSNPSVPQGIGGNFGSVAGGFLPTITDFEVDLSSASNLKGIIHYIPTAEYRRLTMRGKQPIVQIDIGVFWRDVYGNIFPVLIQTNSIVSIKILFEEQ